METPAHEDAELCAHEQRAALAAGGPALLGPHTSRRPGKSRAHRTQPSRGGGGAPAARHAGARGTQGGRRRSGSRACASAAACRARKAGATPRACGGRGCGPVPQRHIAGGRRGGCCASAFAVSGRAGPHQCCSVQHAAASRWRPARARVRGRKGSSQRACIRMAAALGMSCHEERRLGAGRKKEE